MTRNAPGLVIVVVIFVFSVGGAPPAQQLRRLRRLRLRRKLRPSSPQTIFAAVPYTGPRVETPRGLDGKPDLTGYWRPLREAGKPTGNLGKDEPISRCHSATSDDVRCCTARTTLSIRRPSASSAASRGTTAAAFRSRSCTRRSGSPRSTSTTRTGGSRSTTTFNIRPIPNLATSATPSLTGTMRRS